MEYVIYAFNRSFDGCIILELGFNEFHRVCRSGVDSDKFLDFLGVLKRAHGTSDAVALLEELENNFSGYVACGSCDEDELLLSGAALHYNLNNCRSLFCGAEEPAHKTRDFIVDWCGTGEMGKRKQQPCSFRVVRLFYFLFLYLIIYL